MNWNKLIFYTGALLSLVLPLEASDNDSVKDSISSQVNINVDQIVSDWVMSDDARIFCSLNDIWLIREYDPTSGKVVREFNVGKHPRQLVIKNDYLIFSESHSRTIGVIDLKTNKHIGDIPLKGQTGNEGGPYALFCSKAANNFIYVFCESKSLRKKELFQVDIKFLKVNKTQILGQGSYAYAEMSPDGKKLFTGSKFGGTIQNFDEESFQIKPPTKRFDTRGTVTSGPNNRFWVFGEKLYGSDTKEYLRDFDGNHVLLHPKYDLAASLNDPLLTFEKFSTREQLASISIGAPSSAYKGKPGGRDKYRDVAYMKYHENSNSLFYGHSNAASLTSFRKLDVNPDLLLWCAIPEHIHCTINKTLKHTITLSNNELLPETSFKILKGPDGLDIQDKEIYWIPKNSQIGVHNCVIQAEHNSRIHNHSFKITVHNNKIAIDSSIKMWSVNNEGTQALVVYNTPGAKSQFRKRPHHGPDTIYPSTVALVDLTSFKVIATRNYNDRPRSICLANNYGFVLPFSGNDIHQLNIKDLSKVKDVTIMGKLNRLELLPTDKLLVQAENYYYEYSGNTLTYGTPMPELPIHPRTNKRYNTPIAHLINNGYQIGNRVYSNKGTLIKINHAKNFPIEFTQKDYKNNPRTLSLWNRIASSSLSSSHSSMIRGRKNATSLKYPIRISYEKQYNERYNKVNQDLIFYDILFGEKLGQQTFSSVTAPPFYSRTKLIDEYLSIQLRDNNAIVVSDKEIFVIGLNQSWFSGHKTPTYFLNQLPVSADTEQEPFTFTPPFVTESKKVHFKINKKINGMTINEKTGEVTLQTQLIWEQLIKKIKNYKAPKNETLQLHSSDIRKIQNYYEQLTGITTNKIPLPLEIDITVIDELNDQANLKGCIFLLGNCIENNNLLPLTQSKNFLQNTKNIKQLNEKIEALKDIIKNLKEKISLLEPKTKGRRR